MPSSRDPVSVLWDRGARRLLERAYRANGAWAGTRLGNPSPRHMAWAARRGIDLLGPDNATARGGTGLNARTRWGRGFVRAVYYQHRWYSGDPDTGGWRRDKRVSPRAADSLQVQIGRLGPAGLAVRVRLAKGGSAAMGAVKRMPDSRRIYSDDGRPAARWADPSKRDW